MRIASKLVVPLFLLAACQGSREPIVTGVSPDWGSSLTRVTLVGENFRNDPTVWVDGVQAKVISAEKERIVIEPALAVDEPADVSITVQSTRGMSNPVAFRLVPSGTPGPSGLALPQVPNDAVPLGDDLYLAAMGYLTPDSGLYARDGEGIVQRVWEPPPLDWLVRARLPADGTVVPYDAPVQVTTDGTDVWFGTITGTVYRYDPATGRVDQVLASAGSAMDPVRGMAFDDLGNLYLLRDSILRLGPDGTLASLGPDGSYGDLASDGASLYLTDGSDNSITVVDDPASETPAWHTQWVPGVPTAVEASPTPSRLFGIAVVGGDVVVSDSSGHLFGHAVHAVGATDGGPWEVWGNPQGYGYAADGLNADPTGNLFLAQPDSGMVRKLPASDRSFAQNVVAAWRPALGIARLGTNLYLSTTMALTDPAQGIDTILDGAIVELRPDGSSRLVSSHASPTGLVSNGDGTLTLGDCGEQTLTRIDPHDKATTTLADASDGVRCVGQIWRNAGGDLFYANVPLPLVESSRGTVGRLGAGGENDPAFVTGLPPLTLDLTGVEDTLVMSQLVPFDQPILQADATTGGEATTLVPAQAIGFVGALAASPNGAVYAVQAEDRRILEIDVATGRTYPFGDAALGYLGTWYPGDNRVPLCLAFLEDGTLIVPDAGQGMAIAVAP